MLLAYSKHQVAQDLFQESASRLAGAIISCEKPTEGNSAVTLQTRQHLIRLGFLGLTVDIVPQFAHKRTQYLGLSRAIVPSSGFIQDESAFADFGHRRSYRRPDVFVGVYSHDGFQKLGERGICAKECGGRWAKGSDTNGKMSSLLT